MTRYLNLIALVISLYGCVSISTESKTTQTDRVTVEAPKIAPIEIKPAFEPKYSISEELSEDILINYLAAEIGTQRNRLDQAYDFYLQAALLGRDPYAAEKASRIASFLKNPTGAVRSTKLWVEFDPNSSAARETLALLYLEEGQLDLAEKQLGAIVEIAKTRSSDGYFEIAALLIQRSSNPKKIVLIRQFVEKHPLNAEALYAQALVEEDANLYSDAISTLDKVEAMKPEWEKPKIFRSYVLKADNRTKEAIEYLREMAAKFPDSIGIKLALARTLFEEKEYQAAFDEFEHANQLEPDNGEIAVALGMLAIQIEDWAKARSIWKTVREDGNNQLFEEASYFLGQVEEADGNLHLAIDLYESIKRGSLRTDAQIRRGLLKNKLGLLGEMRNIFQELRVLDKSRNIEFYVIEAEILGEHKAFQEALDLLNEAIGVHPKSNDLHYSRGLIAAELVLLEIAESDFKFIIEKEPDDANALNALGFTLTDKTDRHEEALVYILKAHKLSPDSPAIMDSLGWVYYRLDNFKLALKYLRMAAEQISDPEIAAHLGEVLWVTGGKKEAYDIWNSALSEHPKSEILKTVMDRLK